MSSQASSSAAGSGSTNSVGQSTKDAFNAALRSRNPQNNYIAHLKIWEQIEAPPPGPTLSANGGGSASKKARYLIMAVQRDTGKVSINKAKRNANGSFSVGKDWDLNTLKAVHVTSDTNFTLTLARAYAWTTDRPREQYLFLTSLVNVYRKYTRDYDGPKCIGLDSVSSGSTSLAPAAAAALDTSMTGRDTPEHMTSLDSQDANIATPPSSRAQLLPIPNTDDPIPRSSSAEPAMMRPQQPIPATVADPSLQGIMSPSSKPPLFASVNRRPTMNRKESAGAVLQTAIQRSEGPGGQPSYSSSPLSQSHLGQINEQDPPNFVPSVAPSSSSSSSTVVPTQKPVNAQQPQSRPATSASSKDRLADRLARAAAGANSGRSTPNGDGHSIRSFESTTTTSPVAARAPEFPVVPEAAPPSQPSSNLRSAAIQRTPSDASSSGNSSLSLPLSVSNARARLSAIEPVQNRGGKAYERMLLAGTGLKSIGDEDEEEQDDEHQDNAANGGAIEELQDEDDIYGGAVVEDSTFSTSPSKKNKSNKSTVGERKPSRKGTMDKSHAKQTTDGHDSDDDDATLVNVEELLEGIDFKAAHKDPGRLGLGALALGGSGAAAGGGGGAYSAASGALLGRSKGQGTADVIEASLLSELEALDSANIHSILNGDDRLTSVLNFVDEALGQLDAIDSLVASFKLSLNSRAEDIEFIESQNRGLQVMNSNWRGLEREIEQLCQTVNVPQYEVDTLLNPNFDMVGAIEAKEAAAASLYKAILQAKTSQMEENAAAGGMAATTERLGEYSSISTSFSSTIFNHLSTLFSQLVQALLADPSRKALLQPPKPRLAPHEPIEAALGLYCGLMLYVKEVEPKGFERISAAYLTSASESYKEEITRAIGVWKMSVRRAGEEEEAIGSFAPDASIAGGSGGGGNVATNALGAGSLGRAATVRRLGGGSNILGGRKSRTTGNDGEVSGAEAFHHLLLSVTQLIVHESFFISDFLHLNSNGLTFADYMDLETYFRRRAATVFGEEQGERRGGLREMKGAMELLFGFLSGALNNFIEEIDRKDRFQVIGMMGALDAAFLENEDGSGNEFLTRSLNKLQIKVNTLVDKFFAEQLKAVTLSTSAKGHSTSSSSYAPSFRGRKSGRGGLTQAVRVLPHFVDRLESQLVNAQHLNVRSVVDGFYSQLTTIIIDSLLSIKVESSSSTPTSATDEDKGVMNHHVLLIENMHHLIQEVSKLINKAPVLQNLISRAEKMYADSLSAYTHFVLRRPLGKMMDFGDGIDSLLKSTPSNEVNLHNAYSKSSYKKLIKEYTLKDIRKQIDSLWKRVLKHFDQEDESSTPNSTLEFSINNLDSLTSKISSGDLILGSQAEEDERKIVVGKVWKNCQNDFVKEVERLLRIQDECYKGTGNSLDIKVQDVMRLFQR
ncbi:unnamed protein product [Sympodiomycopsis kandeliae]